MLQIYKYILKWKRIMPHIYYFTRLLLRFFLDWDPNRRNFAENLNIVDYEDYDGHFMKLKENDNEEDIKKYVPLKEEKENIDIIDDYEIEDDLDIEEEISDE